MTMDDFNAVANDSSYSAMIQNTEALVQGMRLTSTLVVPRYNHYYIYPTQLENVSNQTLQLDGYIDSIYDSNWINDGAHYKNVVVFNDPTNFTLCGTGGFDGHGEVWWALALENKLLYSRPNLVEFVLGTNVRIYDIHLFNSPQYHLLFTDVLNYSVDSIEITVHSNKVFPFNTDGIDVSGQNVDIRNCIIKNFDDAIAMKPLNENSVRSECTSNVIVSNVTTLFGVGNLLYIS